MPKNLAIIVLAIATAGTAIAADTTTKPAGMKSADNKLVPVPAGEFRMGNSDISAGLERIWDELPIHNVRIAAPFEMATAKVTLEQFRRFRPRFEGTPGFAPVLAGVTWHDAMAYCEWLSKQEGKPYRLPTEAEWEYACRQARLLGIADMCSGAREWCLDWYGPYSGATQVNPIGREWGLARVVRGGSLDGNSDLCRPADYATASNRAGMAPAFGLPSDAKTLAGEANPANAKFGAHDIGFRVVQAPMPAAKPLPYEPSFAQLGVHQNPRYAAMGPKAKTPYFRKRELLPIPPGREKTKKEDIVAAGLDSSLGSHNHSPAITACPNGDLLYVAYTSFHEYEPEVSLMASRLRLGAEEWDIPTPFVDMPNANDHAPLLWNDGGEIYLFWGNPRLPGAFPFQWISSKDSGATWSEVKFPRVVGPVGEFDRQPINSAFRGPDGTMYLAMDAKTSMLWASKDNGQTWFDTGGRTGGRHTTFCLRKDGSILGMGGKKCTIDKTYMPRYVSGDGGKTWQESKSPFCHLANCQRPSVLRLTSGRLFMVADVQNRKDGSHPEEFKERGACVALSDDDGETWVIKSLPGLGGEDANKTVGYAATCQSPDGLIHVVTSLTLPTAMHFALNEAWILARTPASMPNEELMAMSASSIATVQENRENFPDGTPRLLWSGGVADDGQYMPHGRQTWYYPDGKKQWECDFILGCKIGVETFWAPGGSKAWQWEYRMDGSRTWTQYWPSGGKKLQSQWTGRLANGEAAQWDGFGKELCRAEFANGVLVNNVAAGDKPADTPATPAVPPIGMKCYLDRDYTIASVPPELVNGKLVRTLNEAEYSTEKDFLGLTLAGDSIVYVCYWAQAKDLPAWLKEDGWKQIDGTVTVRQKTACQYKVYARKFPEGKISLGGNERETTEAASMYFLVIQPVKK